MWAILGAAFVLGLMIKYWWLCAGASVFYAVLRGQRGAQAARQARAEALAARQAAVALRADEQHNWVIAGDPRGIYGHAFVPLPAGRPRHLKGSANLWGLQQAKGHLSCELQESC
jgi:hypothetical protein